MLTAQSSLVILNAHTPEKQVFWNGTIVDRLVSVKVDGERVILTLKESDQIAEMQAAGIIVRRVP